MVTATVLLVHASTAISQTTHTEKGSQHYKPASSFEKTDDPLSDSRRLQRNLVRREVRASGDGRHSDRTDDGSERTKTDPERVEAGTRKTQTGSQPSHTGNERDETGSEGIMADPKLTDAGYGLANSESNPGPAPIETGSKQKDRKRVKTGFKRTVPRRATTGSKLTDSKRVGTDPPGEKANSERIDTSSKWTKADSEDTTLKAGHVVFDLKRIKLEPKRTEAADSKRRIKNSQRTRTNHQRRETDSKRIDTSSKRTKADSEDTILKVRHVLFDPKQTKLQPKQTEAAGSKRRIKYPLVFDPKRTKSQPKRTEAAGFKRRTKDPQRTRINRKRRETDSKRFKTGRNGTSNDPMTIASDPKRVEPDPERIKPDPQRNESHSRQMEPDQEWAQPSSRQIEAESKRIESDPNQMKPISKEIESEENEHSSKRIESDPKQMKPNSKEIESEGKDSKRIETGPKRIEPDHKQTEFNSKQIKPHRKHLKADPQWLEPDPTRIEAGTKNIETNLNRTNSDLKPVGSDPKRHESDPKWIEDDPKRIDSIPERIAHDHKQIKPSPERTESKQKRKGLYSKRIESNTKRTELDSERERGSKHITMPPTSKPLSTPQTLKSRRKYSAAYSSQHSALHRGRLLHGGGERSAERGINENSHTALAHWRAVNWTSIPFRQSPAEDVLARCQAWLAALVSRLLVLVLVPVVRFTGLGNSQKSSAESSQDKRSKSVTSRWSEFLSKSSNCHVSFQQFLHRSFRFGGYFVIDSSLSTTTLCTAPVVLAVLVFFCAPAIRLWFKSRLQDCWHAFKSSMSRPWMSAVYVTVKAFLLVSLLLQFCRGSSETPSPDTENSRSHLASMVEVVWPCVKMVIFVLSQNAFNYFDRNARTTVFFRLRKPLVLKKIKRLTVSVAGTMYLRLSKSLRMYPRVTIVSFSLRLLPNLSCSLVLTMSLRLIIVVVISMA